MSYEYLKGMGAAGMSNQGNQGMSNQGRQSPPPSSDPPPGGGAGQFGRTQQNAGASNQNAGANNRGMSNQGNQGAQGSQNTPAVNFVGVAYRVEPAVPAGSVKTLPAERVELKEYCKRRFGATSAFYTGKVRLDPSFTHMTAVILSEYRNNAAVVRDMLTSPPDTAVTLADITAFKAWWKKCHLPTFTLFEIRQSNATWVPQAPSLNFKRTFKVTNACPAGADKTRFFQYKVTATAAQLLTQEVERQRVETVNRSTAAESRAEEEARVAQEALTAAQTQLRDLQTQLDTSRADLTTSRADLTAARNEATRWREEATKATTRANELQTAIDGLGKNINTLTNQLAATTSPEAAAILQAQIADLTGQLSTAQTLQAEAIAQAQAAQAAAAQTETVVAQTEVVVAQTQAAVDTTAAQVEALEPWYIKYKWYLVGAAVLAGGAYWYMNKQKAAAVPAPTKNWLPEPTSARRPSGLRRNAYDDPNQSDSGRPPRNAPKIIWNLFLNMARSARENGGNSPDASIYWSRRGKQWSIGDNFDRYGHFIAKPTGSGEYSLIYRGEWGDEPISLKHAMRQARRFFEEGGAADAFRCTMGG